MVRPTTISSLPPSPARLAPAGALLLLLALASPSCETAQIAVTGETSTPSHNLPKDEYPFDAQGNYREDWVRTPRPVSSSPASTSRSSYPASSSTSSSSSGSSSSSSIGPSTPAPTPPPTRRQMYHTVASGDTLWGISRRYSVSVTSLKQENGLKSDVIQIGDVLRIP